MSGYQQNKAVIDYLRKLVAFPSTSREPNTDIAAWVAQHFADLGFEVSHFYDDRRRQQANVICRLGPQGSGGLTLSGHMDVVPVAGQHWQSDPFVLTEHQGRLYGRGAVDMKGFIAATLAALGGCRPRDFKRELALVWTYDEEVGCLGSHSLVQQAERLATPLPSRCVVGEPTDRNMIVRHNGILCLHVTLKGKAAHSSQPGWGCNTIEDAARLIQAAGDFARRYRQPVDPLLARDHQDAFTTFNMATIAGGLAYNVIPERCELRISARPIPGVDTGTVLHELMDTLKQVPVRSSLGFAVDAQVSPMATDDPAVMPLLQPYACCQEAGAVAYATDGANLQQLGLEPVIFGPGSIRQAHTADEFIDTGELLDFVPRLRHIIQQACLNDT